MARPDVCKRACTLFLICGATAIASPAQPTFTTLASFDWSNGASPALMSLVQGLDGDFYGTTYWGGAYGYGTIFKIARSGELTTLYNFCAQSNCPDGAGPVAGLVLGTDGNFYGTASAGGARNFGTVFKISPSGTLTTLYCFCTHFACDDGGLPEGGLIQARDGNLYGTTLGGGAGGDGTVFRITPSGTLTTLHSFCARTNCTDGSEPQAGLVQASDGNFYGTTSYGGAHDSGTVFKIAPGGTLTTLYAFCAQAKCSDGAYSEAGLVQATSGNFYGTTAGGGTSGYGTVFKITPSGTLTTLHSFCAQTNCTDGAYPRAELVQATDGNFYGTTYSGGSSGNCNAPPGCGTVFRITPLGRLSTLNSFDGTDGSYLPGGLIQATDGKLYGTTYSGGTSGNCNAPPGCGTAFRVTVGLGPFVEALPYSGKVGATIDFLGEGLAATTGVSFNGTAASFTVKSETYLTATVPSGAATGYVTVVTPGGLLKSNKKFRVTQ